MSYNSAFEAEMRRYQNHQLASNIACTLTSQQLRYGIEQDENPNARRRRRASDFEPKRKRRPFFLRIWFLLLASTLLGGVYFVKAGYMQKTRNLTENIKATTGVDLLSIDTYKNLLEDPEEQGTPTQTSPVFEPPLSPEQMQEYNYDAQTMDMREIEAEARRLEELAREFDRQFGNQPQE